MNPKQIIVDKDVFQETNTDDLCDFAKNHFFVVPMNLYSECATNDEQRPILFERFRELIISDGHTCSTVKDIIQQEGRSLLAFDFQADVDKETNEMRQKFERGYKFAEPNTDDIRQSHNDSAQTLLDRHSEVADIIGGAEFKVAAQEVRKCTLNRQGRFKRWVQAVDGLNIHELAKIFFTKFTSFPEKCCLSSNWMTWHYIRLHTVLVFEYKFLKGKRQKDQLTVAEHDLHDVEYVVLLSQVNGLLTRDKRLVRPLAKAAFPGKDVFSSLDEVPEEYVCHWT